MKEKGKACKISRIMAVLFWIVFTASAAYAELKIESVSPNQGVAGLDLPVTITGSGFDEKTRALMYLDTENEIEIQPVTVNSETGISLTLPGPAEGGKYMLKVFNETENHEIAVYFKGPLPVQKAIIVAGGGPSSGDWVNHLWEATQTVTNHAYTTLLHQGYDRENIFYLNPENTDADDDGYLNDMDGDATLENLSYAINTWAKDPNNPAHELLIYMTGHGGEGVFILNATERRLYAEDLSNWLDDLQITMPGRVIFIYDASQAGTFIPLLTPSEGKERIVITSVTSEESVFFLDLGGIQGSLSFSFQFWSAVLFGDGLKDAFYSAKYIMDSLQSAWIDADGDGRGSELDDFTLIEDIKIGELSSELKLESKLDPDIGVVGQDLVATLTGTGFDENTKVSMYLDVFNKIEIESVTVNSETSISLTLPAPPKAGRYTLIVSNEKENRVAADTVIFAPWTPKSGQQLTMEIDGQAYIDNVRIETAGYVIVAFGPGGDADCRGISDVNDSDGEWTYHLTATSDNNGEEITFKIWDSNTGQIHNATGTILFETDAVIKKDIDPPFKLESVSPNWLMLGKDEEVTLTGTRFNEDVRVFMYPDVGNKRLIIGSVDIPGAARDVAVIGDTAYMAALSGLRIIDVSNPERPLIIGSVNTPGRAFGVTVVGGTAYMADYDKGITIINISTPGTPEVISTGDTPGYANDVTVLGNTAFVADGSEGLQIMDISTPSSPLIIGTADTPGYAKGITVSGDTAYIADGLNGLQIIDTADPRNPLIIGSADTPGYANEVAVSGDMAFVADRGSGLQIIDVSSPETPGLSVLWIHRDTLTESPYQAVPSVLRTGTGVCR